MKPKEEHLQESQTEVQVGSPFTLKGILICHAFLTIVAFFTNPLWLWSQVAMASFWLALGKGPIWSRLLWLASGGFILAIFMAGPFVPSEALPSVLWTVVFTCLFTGIGIILLGQIPRWTLLFVQFLFWEMIVGTACLGFGFFVVNELVDITYMPRSLWETIYYILINSSLLGLGTAAIGITLMARPGRPRTFVRCAALLLTILIPCIDYLAYETLQFERFKIEDRVSFYLMNLAIVWVTVLLYQDAVNSGERMIFETNCDQEEAEGSNDAS